MCTHHAQEKVDVFFFQGSYQELIFIFKEIYLCPPYIYIYESLEAYRRRPVKTTIVILHNFHH